MNEILKKLADDCRTLYRDGSGEYVEQFDEEKFAELIVEECLYVMSKVSNGYHDYRNQIEDAMRDACVDDIKKHFGVEE